MWVVDFYHCTTGKWSRRSGFERRELAERALWCSSFFPDEYTGEYWERLAADGRREWIAKVKEIKQCEC